MPSPTPLTSFGPNRAGLAPKLAAVLIGNALALGPAQALDIQLIDIGTNPMTAQQLAAFEAAAQLWESKFIDPITVVLNVAWDDPETFSSEFVLASTSSARTTVSAATTRTQMIADATTGSEGTAMAALPTPNLPLSDINGGRNDDDVTMTFANAKALGITPALDPVYGAGLANSADGEIRYNSGYAPQFDLDRSDGIGAAQKDFIGVAAHEIGHALGFISLTDVQDNNPGFTLHPSTLDLWRFAETGGFHNVGNENRQVTAADAEFYDGLLNNVPFSRGTMVTDPLCNSNGNTCQASHWQDDQGNLMDPTVADGVQVDLTSEDRTAMDHIGYNPRLYVVPWWRWRFVRLWLFEPQCLRCPPLFHREFYRQFAYPPELKGIKAPFEGANVAMMMLLDGESEAFKGRSGVGFARFEREDHNPDPRVIKPLSDHKGWEQEAFSGKPLEMLPPRLMDFYLESDYQAGPRFSLRASFSRDGAPFDPTIGKFGGFRISATVDSEVDGRGDVDGTLTLVLLLTDELDINESITKAQFVLDKEMLDNGLKIVDYKAFGLESPQPVKYRY